MNTKNSLGTIAILILGFPIYLIIVLIALIALGFGVGGNIHVDKK